LANQAIHHAGRIFAVDLDQYDESGLTFNQDRDMAVPGAREEIALPMSGYRPILNFGQPLPDRYGIDDLTTGLAFGRRGLVLLR
jgi:hypothetical protein